MITFKIKKTAYKSIFELVEINSEPYETKQVIFSGSIADCVAYITALKDNLITN
jgi:hypothetical protein